MDLFGETITHPTIAESSMKSLLNASHGFVEFWKAWPTGPRKTGKQQALNKWAKLVCCENATLILQHLEYMKASQQWKDGFVPMPVTHLNRQGWLDFVPDEVKPKVDTWTQEFEAHLKKAVPMPEYLKRRVSPNTQSHTK
jgi:hypothetical protein